MSNACGGSNKRVHSINQLFEDDQAHLEEKQRDLWILIDRLDAAFPEEDSIEPANTAPIDIPTRVMLCASTIGTLS